MYAVIDTETLGADNRLIYDIAIAICDRYGNVITARRWLNSQVLYLGNKSLNPKSMYFFRKLEWYRDMFRKTPSVRQDWKTITEQLNDMLEQYDVEVICAYNLGFDLGALTFTSLRHTGKDHFFRKDYPIIDIWTIACETICQQKTYRKQAQEHGWISEKGNVKTSAEVVYRYLTQKFDFVEEHGALEDCFIEVKILAKVLSLHKKITKWRLVANPWRLAQVKKD